MCVSKTQIVYSNFKFFLCSRVICHDVFSKIMDSFEINKIIAAILLTALIIIGIGKLTDFLFYVKKPEQTAYKIDGLETATSEKKTSQPSHENFPPAS